MEAEIIGMGVIGMLVGMILVMFGYVLGDKNTDNLKREIVKRGFGIWKPDEDGNTEFKWKE